MDGGKIPGGFKVLYANGQAIAYVYSRENPNLAEEAASATYVRCTERSGHVRSPTERQLMTQSRHSARTARRAPAE
jgi:hypothetical protein